MAHNFKIFMHRNRDNIHINLMSDFDGSSAFELLNTLNENLNRTKLNRFVKLQLWEVLAKK